MLSGLRPACGLAAGPASHPSRSSARPAGARWTCGRTAEQTAPPSAAAAFGGSSGAIQQGSQLWNRDSRERVAASPPPARPSKASLGQCVFLPLPFCHHCPTRLICYQYALLPSLDAESLPLPPLAPNAVKVYEAGKQATGKRIVAETVVQAPVEVVWRVLTGYERLADFVPNLESCERLPSPRAGKVGPFWAFNIYLRRKWACNPGTRFVDDAGLGSNNSTWQVHCAWCMPCRSCCTSAGVARACCGVWRHELSWRWKSCGCRWGAERRVFPCWRETSRWGSLTAAH